MGVFADESYAADLAMLVAGMAAGQIWSWLQSFVWGAESPHALSRRICSLIQERTILRDVEAYDLSGFLFPIRPAPSPISDALLNHFGSAPDLETYPIYSSYIFFGPPESGKTWGAFFFFKELMPKITYQGAEWTGLPGICFSPSLPSNPTMTYEDTLRGLLGVDPEMKADDFRNALYGGMRMAAQPSWLERCVRFYNLVWHKKEHVIKPIVVVFDGFDRAAFEWFNVFNFGFDCMKQFDNSAVVPIFITQDKDIADALAWLNNGSRIRPHPAVYDPDCPYGRAEYKKRLEIKWKPITWSRSDYERLVAYHGRMLPDGAQPTTPRLALARSHVTQDAPPAHELESLPPKQYVPPDIEQ